MHESRIAVDLVLHRGQFVLLQHADGRTTYLLLIRVELSAQGSNAIGYEDGELTIDGPITVPLSDVVEWIGEDE